jgi:hypothetical protein
MFIVGNQHFVTDSCRGHQSYIVIAINSSQKKGGGYVIQRVRKGAMEILDFLIRI